MEPAAVEVEAGPPDHRKDDVTDAQARAGIIAVVAVFGLMFLVMSMCPEGPPPEPDRAERIGASFECERAVRERLVSPSTAEFPPYRRQRIARTPDGRYRVSAYVDAQNRFGATVRNNYTCEVSILGDTRSVEDVQILTR